MLHAFPPAETVKLSREERRVSRVLFSVVARNIIAASSAVEVCFAESLTVVKTVAVVPIFLSNVFKRFTKACSFPQM